MPYLSEGEIDNLVSRAVSKALGSHKGEQRTANHQAVNEIVDSDGDERPAHKMSDTVKHVGQMKAMGSNVPIFEVRFQVVKAAPPGSSSAWQYRKEMRKALVQAPTIQDLQTVLNADIVRQSGEWVDILTASQVSGAILG